MIFLVLGIPLIFGLFTLSLLLQKQAGLFGVWEKLAFAFSVGLGFLTIIMFLLASFKIPLTFSNLILSVFLITLLSGIFLVKAKTFLINFNEIKASLRLNPLKLDPIELLLTFLITLKIIYAYFTAIIKPLADVDAFQFYSIVAKGIFYAKTFVTPYLQQFMGDKPPFAFLSQGWVFVGLHSIDDALLKIISPTLFLCFIIIFYSILKRYYARKISLLFTFFLSTLPFILYHVGTAYADFPMTFYYALGTIFLYFFMKEHSRNNPEQAHGDLMLSMLFLAIAVWVKRAGLVLVGVNIAVLLTYLFRSRKRLSRVDINIIILALLLFIITILPWLIQGQLGTFARLITSLTGQAAQAPAQLGPAAPSVPPLDKTGTIISVFMRKLFLYADWQLTWGLFIIALVFFYRRIFNRPLNYLLAMLSLAVLSIFVQFESGEMFQWLLDGTLFDRLIMNEVPVALFLCAEAICPSILAVKDNF